MLKTVAQLRAPAETLLENSAAYDSSGNCFAERAVRSVEEMVRVLKLDLDARIGKRREVNISIFLLLVEHAVHVLTKLHVANHGKMAFGRTRGLDK